MQAKNTLISNIKHKLQPLLDSANELTKLQVGLIISLLALITIGAVFAYVRSRPQQIGIKEAQIEKREEQSRKVTVHVAGAVVKPGLYKVREGSRVADVLSMAGGQNPQGMIDELNLAARLKDGQKIIVPSRNQILDSFANEIPSISESMINVNSADQTELEELPGVGPSTAEKIIEYRKRNGPFSSIEELDNVDGIGKRRIETLEGQVTI